MMQTPVRGAVRCGACVALIAGFTTGLGCSQNEPSAGIQPLAPLPRPVEPDLPVPIGFSFVESVSEDHSAGNRRLYVRHWYEGPADKLSVRSFYREQMPLARWQKVSDGNVKGEYALRYAKGNEICTVTIRDAAAGRKQKTAIQLIVAPDRQAEGRPRGAASPRPMVHDLPPPGRPVQGRPVQTRPVQGHPAAVNAGQPVPPR